MYFFLKKMTTYQLSSIKQLIDLNGEAVNFNLDFEVKATNGETFQALVVTQETLDSNQTLNYQTANGSISGSINSDKGHYQNYFLVLRADQPTEVTVSVNIEELPDNTISNLDDANYHHQQHLMNNQNENNGKKKSWFVRNRTYLLIGFLVLCLIGVVWFVKDTQVFSSVFSNEVNEKLNGGFKQLNDTIDGINTGLSTKLSGIDGLNSKIEDISSEINGLKGGINESLKSDTVLTKIDGLASEINGIKGGLSETINTKIDGLREGYETLSSKLNERLIPDNTDFGEIKETLDSIKRQVGDLSLTPAPVAPLSGDGGKTTSNVEDIFQKVKKLQINT